MIAHVARRVRGAGASVVVARTPRGAPLWREVASRLDLTDLDCDPARCAEQIALAAVGARAVLVVPLSPPGTWDRCVAAELTLLPHGPLVVFVTSLTSLMSITAPGRAELGPQDLRAERFDVSASLDLQERTRWWSGVAEEADVTVASGQLAALEAWWESAMRSPVAHARPLATEIPPEAGPLYAALGLAGRAWPVADLPALVGADERAVQAMVALLVATRGAHLERGWFVLDPDLVDPVTRTGLEDFALAKRDAAMCSRVAEALCLRFTADPWAHARAAELLLGTGRLVDADREQANTLSLALDPVARREIVRRWMRAVDGLPVSAQLGLRVSAAERALAVGEADEAYRWAQTAAGLQPSDASVTLLLGRASVALGDLVGARVALERGQLERGRPHGKGEDDARLAGLIAVELAEVAYLSGDLEEAHRESTRAMALGADVRTNLRARNTLGKILLAESKWDAAERHFTEDAQLAASHGEPTAELRARLNRGIALLSKGLVDEARTIFESVLAEGERVGDMRACAFALDNLAVVATWRHEYASALQLSERTLKLRQRLGDKLTTARILANLAILRCKLGLLEHADHAIAFGRRLLGPGMPPARSAHFSVVAAQVALARGNSIEARREIAVALVDSESAHVHEYIGAAHRLAARLALEDGDRIRARSALDRARELATTDDWRAEVALLAALLARASGEDAEPPALEALRLARLAGEEELLREVHVLLCEIYRSSGDFGNNLDRARAHLDQAVMLRDQVSGALPPDVSAAFLARPDVAALQRLQSQLAEPTGIGEPAASEPATQRAGSIRPPATGLRELVGDDPAMRGLMAAVRKISRANSTVLIRGESGTGKELVAELLHKASDRAHGPMVTVNCAALVETLLLSELFGHEKGAFTGAFARRRGRFELAEGGTLFLDEIGDISPKTQVALLRVLQERTFERVGGTTPLRADVRIICATHRDLRAMVERGDFREDLYYRLRGITLEVPPLRLRMGDLPRIAQHLLSRIATERGEVEKTLAADAVELLSRHRWPGNVRELENALRAASLFAEAGTITAATLADNVDDLRGLGIARQPSDRSPPSFAGTALPSESGLDVCDRDDAALEGLEGSGEVPLPPTEAGATAVAYAQVRQGAVSLSDMKRQIERDCIARALAETKGNITRAAALLGMKRPRLSQLVKQYGLSVVSSEASS